MKMTYKKSQRMISHKNKDDLTQKKTASHKNKDDFTEKNVWRQPQVKNEDDLKKEDNQK